MVLVGCISIRPTYIPSAPSATQILPLHGVGASSATVAQAAEQVPSAVLHAMMAAGAAGAAMVPNVAPAAA